ncbi:transmembrane protein, putative [Medicago truncatula]|uniref:Transmembrane protein, putative n=1 Tax=Medicago truncatula TaxID=3880 RepID=A0A072UMT2_MEDTR|nr:transmembrane protein, putative [Medicago truncatula]
MVNYAALKLNNNARTITYGAVLNRTGELCCFRERMNGESVGDALFLGWLNLMMKMKEFDDEGEEGCLFLCCRIFAIGGRLFSCVSGFVSVFLWLFKDWVRLQICTITVDRFRKPEKYQDASDMLYSDTVMLERAFILAALVRELFVRGFGFRVGVWFRARMRVRWTALLMSDYLE